MPKLTITRRPAEQRLRSTEERPAELGARVKELRVAREWTLEEASQRIGLSRSALSKIERNEMSPTFHAMQKLAAGFSLDLLSFLASGEASPPAGRRSVTRKDDGTRHETPNYGLRLLMEEVRNTAFMVVEVLVRARGLDQFPDWDRHDDEDFMYVLDGEITLYTEHYAPAVLKSGDAVYFDARLGHACISTSDGDARLLWVTAPLGGRFSRSDEDHGDGKLPA
ncbi:transcriptional regulator with XRE-family HTH domain [Ensifer adhaerens]|uniref:Transcriptional regulator with XRE-family HTH domain n=1 Tax=Ensifer adhaerens TaxID=106592 RepID=A0ACC5T343_ENSAD|nr:XRE family transcriptional regulator [Ensifer adhaerens]MBP1875394.1 transcriptional regulator with XRE-family HTH domain [Ensifer adhaerens]